MKTKNRKGFTLTELIVVIVIIAILAAVLIPTYTGIVKKARISSDTQLVKSMNDALTLANVESGKPETMADAIAIIKESGYLVEKLTPTTSHYNIVWSQVTGHMSLLDEDGNKVYSPDDDAKLANKWTLWKVAQNGDGYSDGYSYYLTDSFEGTIAATAGIDVGENDDITSITYTRAAGTAHDIIIRTLGGTLTINAPSDTVKHYGTADKVTITAVASASYDEYGSVIGFIFLNSGHVKIIKKTNQVSSSSGVVIQSGSVSATVDDKTPVIYANSLDATAISTLQSNIVASVNYTSKTYDVTTLNESAGGLGTEESPFVITNANFKTKLTSSNGEYYKLSENISIDLGDFDNATNYCYIKQFNGKLYGNDKRIIINNAKGVTMNSSAEYIHRVFDQAKGELRDFTVVNNTGNVVSIIGGKADGAGKNYELLFNNVDYGYEGINKSVFFAQKNNGLFSQSGVSDITFVDCANYYDITSIATYVGIFVGGRVDSNAPALTKLSFTNCRNYGDVYAAANFGILLGNSNGNRTKTNTIVTNCSNYGAIRYINTYKFLGFDGESKNTAYANDLNTGLSTTENGSVEKITCNTRLWSTSTQGSDLMITKDPNITVTKYVLRYFESFSLMKTGEAGKKADLSMIVDIEIDPNNLSFTDNVANSDYKRVTYTSKGTYEENYKHYNGTWATTDNKIKYFIDSEHNLIVFDFDQYFAAYKTKYGLDETYYYDASTGIAINYLFGYNEGTVVAYAQYEQVS